MLVGTSPRRVAVVGGSRIPFARANGAYASVGNQEMLTASLKAVVDKHALKGVRLGDVVAGAVMKHSSQWNLTRESLLDSGLSPETPGLDVQRACGTSLEAAIIVANKIALGQIDAGIAGGVDTVSDPPVVFGKGYQQILLRAHRARSFGERAAAFLSLRPSNFKPVFPGTGEPRTGLSMGQHTEQMARTWQITREEQDAFALASHQRASRAWSEGFMADLVVPYLGPAVRQQRAPRHEPREAREAEALVRGRRHADRGQLDADDGRLGRGAARERGLGARARPAGAGVPDARQGRRRSTSSAARGC